MKAQYLISHQRESQFQETYFNKYLTGRLAFALMKAFLHTFGILFYFSVVSIVLLAIPLAFLLDWQNFPAKIREQWEQGHIQSLFALTLVGFLGLLGIGVSIQMLIKTWTTFARIVRSHLYFGSGQPLSSVEGPPTFSGGRRSLGRTGGKSPDKLEVGGRRFDLNHCWRVSELLKLSRVNFVGAEPLASGIATGFTLQVPLRIWYVPATGVLARVEMRPVGQSDLLRRAQTLKQRLDDWYQIHATKLSQRDVAKTGRLSKELESLETELASGMPESRKQAEEHLANLEEWLGFLGVRAGEESSFD
jgi:hypothetical protein